MSKTIQREKDSFSVKLYESLNSPYGQYQQRAEENRNEPPKVKETLKETNPKKGQRSTGT